VNIDINRWAIKPELDISKTLGPLKLYASSRVSIGLKSY
jgi:hypothetical protein